MILCYPPANLETTPGDWKEQEFLFGLSKKKLRIEVSSAPSKERITVLLPVLNETGRIDACLTALCRQPDELQEILVVDGGSNDGTQGIVERHHATDDRVRLIDASPVDPNWTGKAWDCTGVCRVRQRPAVGYFASTRTSRSSRSWRAHCCITLKEAGSRFFPSQPVNGCQGSSKPCFIRRC